MDASLSLAFLLFYVSSTDFFFFFFFIFSVNVSTNDDPILGKDLTLSVNTTGHVVHAFVNRERIGNYRYCLCLSSFKSLRGKLLTLYKYEFLLS